MPEPTVASKQMIEQIFDASATSYDRTGPSIFAQFGARLAGQVPLAPGARVLDVATGAGAVLLPVARRVGPGGRVIGIDISAGILQEADRAVQAEGLTNVELRKMDAEHLDFPDQTFDAVICAFALFLFPDIEAALREMHRVCKPGGYVGTSVFGNTPPPFNPGWPLLFQHFEAHGGWVRMPQPIAYAPEETEALLSRSGFRFVVADTETNDIVYGSTADWWAFLLTLGPRPTIMAMDDETRARFKDEYLGKLRPLLREDGLHMSVSVVYTTGQK